MAIVVVGWARSAGRATYNVTMHWRAKTTASRPDQKRGEKEKRKIERRVDDLGDFLGG